LVDSAVVLSGGRSSRMGQDKALLPFGEFGSLSEFQYRRLKSIFNKVYISTKEDKFDFKANLILDKGEIFSPMVALKSILEELQESCFVISVDTPFVSESSIKRLLAKFESGVDVVVAKHSKQLEPLCAIYNPTTLKNIDLLLSQNIHKLNYLLKISKLKVVDFKESFEFENLNYFSDYQRAKNSLRG
jgi:molybdopterin-guanine dinucleotide biosynthesis protein A